MIPKDKLKVLVVEVFRLWRKNKKDPNQSELPLQPQPSSTKSQQLSFGLPYKDPTKLPAGQLSLNIPHLPYLPKKELMKRMEKPPFYQNPKKWRKDNFEGGPEYKDNEVWREDPKDPIIYKGEDLSAHGFDINGQTVKPLEKVEYPVSLFNDIKGHMYRWNIALAAKLGLAPKPSWA